MIPQLLLQILRLPIAHLLRVAVVVLMPPQKSPSLHLDEQTQWNQVVVDRRAFLFSFIKDKRSTLSTFVALFVFFTWSNMIWPFATLRLAHSALECLFLQSSSNPNH